MLPYMRASLTMRDIIAQWLLDWSVGRTPNQASDIADTLIERLSEQGYVTIPRTQLEALEGSAKALEPFALFARGLYVSGHCGGASPEDFPAKWIMHASFGPHMIGNQIWSGCQWLMVRHFREAEAKITALRAAGIQTEGGGK